MMLNVAACVRELCLNSTITQEFMNRSLWNSYVATVYFGMCHTFNYPQKIMKFMQSNLKATTALPSIWTPGLTSEL